MKKLLYLLLLAPLLFSLTTVPGCSPSTDTPVNDTITPKDLKAINDQIQKDPKNADLYLKRAKYYQQHQQLGEALSDVNRMLNIDSTKTVYLSTGADIFFAANQTSRCKQVLERLVKLEPDNKEAVLRLAQLYHFVKMYQPEFDLLNELLKKDDKNAQAYYMKGVAWKEIGDTVKAISSLETAVKLDPDHYNACIQLGVIMNEKKDSRAVGYYETALRIRPNSEEALYNLGKHYQETQDWNKAMDTYTLLLKVNPKHFDAHFNLGTIHIVNKNYDLALGFFNQAIADDPQEHRGYYGRGFAYEMKGDITNAKTDYQKALALKPDYENAQLALGRITKGDAITGQK